MQKKYIKYINVIVLIEITVTQYSPELQNKLYFGNCEFFETIQEIIIGIGGFL